MSSRKEIRDSVLKTTRQETNTTLSDMVNDYINLTLNEINNPAWAFREDVHHSWSFLRQKLTFATVASTSDYLLAREVDKIALVRQTSTPIKLTQVPDKNFFELVPNPTDTGNPLWYRLWEEEGVSTRLTADSILSVVSSSASDAGSSELKVTVRGHDSNGIPQVETFTLNGTGTVAGTITWDSDHELFISKQKNTTGTITVTNASAVTILKLGPTERNPKFKVISLYPIPSGVLTMYVEYYTRIPILINDSDNPIFDDQWHYIVRLGALAKAYQYLNKETDFTTTNALYASSLRSMVASDTTEPDLINYLKRHETIYKNRIRVYRDDETS